MLAASKNTGLVSRRRFLKVCALLGVGALGVGFRGVTAMPSAASSEFVVISGWVLPAQYFGKN
jgi:hypothetical protein